jgi:hypothetical protein
VIPNPKMKKPSRLPGIWVIVLQRKRGKSREPQMVAATSAGLLHVLFLEKECASQLKVPLSWLHWYRYKPDAHSRAEFARRNA